LVGALGTRVSGKRSRRADSRDHEIASIKAFPWFVRHDEDPFVLLYGSSNISHKHPIVAWA
jgi:hypothetical protein